MESAANELPKNPTVSWACFLRQDIRTIHVGAPKLWSGLRWLGGQEQPGQQKNSKRNNSSGEGHFTLPPKAMCLWGLD